MAFQIQNLSIGRGEFNNCCSGSSEPAWHCYVTADSLSTVTSPNYFPDYLGAGESFVKPNDVLWVGAKTDQKNVNFVLNTTSPVSLINLDPDPLYYANSYTASVASGGSGTLQFNFRRDDKNNVTFGIYSTQSIVTSSPSPIFIQLNFSVPPIYAPSPIYQSFTLDGVKLPTFLVNSANGNIIPVVFRINSSVIQIIDYRLSANLPANTNMIFQHFSMSYIGQ